MGTGEAFPTPEKACPNPKDAANHLEFVSGACLLGWEARVEPSGEKWDRFIMLVEAITTPTWARDMHSPGIESPAQPVSFKLHSVFFGGKSLTVLSKCSPLWYVLLHLSAPLALSPSAKHQHSTSQLTTSTDSLLTKVTCLGSTYEIARRKLLRSCKCPSI